MRISLIAGILIWASLLASARAEDQPSSRPAIAAGQIFILQRAVEDPARAVPLLHRELIRQAILIAARDELGLFTRDRVLRESVPDSLGDVSARTVTPTIKLNGVDNVVQQLDCGTNKAWLATDRAVTRGGRGQKVFDEAAMLPKIEARSRTTFVEFLRTAGLTGHAAPPGQTNLPPEVETRLEELSIIAQFDALRRIEGLIRQKGESPALLGGLVRAYANLASLTRFHWSAATEVFAARSLLYGQRLTVKYESPAAHQHLAYAMAMAGLHAAALNELNKAPLDKDSPAWAGLIEPLCKYDTKSLQSQLSQQNPQRSLASYMALLTAEHCGSVAAVMNTARVAQQNNPHCEQVVDAVLQVGGVSTMNQYGPVAFSVAVEQMRQGLDAMGPLPLSVQNVRLAAHQNPDLMQDLADVSQSLVDANDDSEPSLPVLGRLLQDSNFMHAFQETYHIAEMLGMDPAEFVAGAAPLLKDHPYAGVIDVTASYWRKGQPAPPQVKWIDLKMSELGGEMTEFWQVPAQSAGWPQAWRIAEWHLDPDAYGMEAALDIEHQYESNNDLKKHGLALRWISPFAPAGMAALLQSDWAAQKGNLDQWLSQTGNSPNILKVAAVQFHNERDYASASKYLGQYIAAAPDAWAYEMLADCHLSQNDEQGWLKTLQEGLQHEDFGLDSAEMNDDIAKHYMDQRQWQKALPYADAAATSGAGWAMNIAMRCHVQLEDWQAAETLAEQQDGRYGPFPEWYLWCRASGRGDIAAARKSARTYVALDYADAGDTACFYAGESDAPDEIAVLKEAAITQGNPFLRLWLAMVYDATGKTPERDAAIAETIQMKPQQYDDEIQVAQMLQDAIQNNHGELRMDKFTQAFANLPVARRASTEYFAAEWLIHHGHIEQGVSLLKTVAVEQNDESDTVWLARFELHDRGIDPFALPSTNP